ncbi:MAG: hypothetical protein J3Q66DRAFT_396086 [Benniella sp.]|nr:MAG: hypothetical protein J3Q66DRAFT_396086 [Benniella sp.]
MAFALQKGYTDSFFSITEDALLSVLLRGAPSDLKDVLVNVFESQGKAKEHAAHHPGDHFFRLFFSDGNSYMHGLCLTNPAENIPGDRALLGGDLETTARHDNLTQRMNTRDAAPYLSAKKDFQEFLKECLCKPEERKEDIRGGNDWKRHVLTGTISTNGHELKVLATSLTKAAPPPSLKKRPNTTRPKLKDVRDVLADDDQVATIFENQESHIVVGIDPGIKSTATCCILDLKDVGRPRNVTIPQGAHTFTTKAYNQGLDHAKKKANIQELESRIVPIECPQAETGRQKTAWRHLQLSIHNHYQSVLKVATPLRAFYTKMMFKIKSYHLKQALKATVTKGIDRVIAAAQKGEPGADPIKPLFVVGDGQFGAAHETTTAHTTSRGQPFTGSTIMSGLPSSLDHLNERYVE